MIDTISNFARKSTKPSSKFGSDSTTIATKFRTIIA